MKLVGVMAVALFACGADDPPPSCQDAWTHFYGVGCAVYNLATNPPTPYTLAEAIQGCQQVNAAVPDRCQSFFDDYQRCINGVKDSATCADCSQEQDALFGCQ